MIILEVKFEWNVKGITEETPGHRNVNIATSQETLDVHPGELSEDEHIDIKDKNNCHRKDEDLEEVTPAKNFTLKKISEIFFNIESTKDKVLEGDPNLECANSPKLRKDYVLSYTTRRRQSLTLDELFQRWNKIL